MLGTLGSRWGVETDEIEDTLPQGVAPWYLSKQEGPSHSPLAFLPEASPKALIHVVPSLARPGERTSLSWTQAQRRI